MKTPKQLAKYFFGTIVFVFLTVVASIYIFSNTLLNYYLFKDLQNAFPGTLKCGFLSSDLLSYISFKGVTLTNTPKCMTGTPRNTQEVGLGSFFLEGSVIDAIMGKPNFSLNFSQLDMTLVSDGKNIFFPACSGLAPFCFSSGIYNYNPLGSFRSVSFKDCSIRLVLFDDKFANVQKTITLANFSGSLSPRRGSLVCFNSASTFDYEDEYMRLEKVNFIGLLDIEKMYLSGNATTKNGKISNLSGNAENLLKFDGLYSCNYDFTIFLSKLSGNSSEYLSGNADFTLTSAEVSFSAPSLGATHITGITGTVALNSANLKLGLRNFTGRIGSSEIAATGEIDLHSEKIDLTLSGKGLNASLLTPSLEGNFEASAQIAGSFAAPRYSAGATAKKLIFVCKSGEKIGASEITAELSSSTSEVSLDNLSCSCLGGQIQAAGKISPATMNAAGTIKVSTLRAAAILKEISAINVNRDFDIKKGVFTFEGKIPDYSAFEVSGTAETTDYNLLSENLIVNSFTFKMKNGVINFPVIAVATENRENKSEISGKYNITTGEYSFNGNKIVINPSAIPALKNFARFASRLSGLAALNIGIDGATGWQKIKFGANIEKVKLDSTPFGFDSIRGEISRDGKVYNIGSLKFDDSLTLESGSIDGADNFRLAFNLYEVNISQVKKFVKSEWLSKLSGSLTGSLNVSGNTKAPDSIHASADIRSLDIKYQNLRIKNLSTLKVKSNRTRIDFDNFRLGVNEQPVTVTGFLEFDESKEMGLKVRLDETDLNFLKLYASKAVSEVSGKIDLELALNGTIKEPRFNGFANVTAKTLKLAGVGESFSDIDLKFESRNYEITLKKGVFKFGKSEWEAGGDAKINSGGAPLFLDMTLSCSGFKHELGKQSFLEGNAKLGLKGSALAPRLYGSCKITKGKIELSKEILAAKRENVEVGPVELDVIIFADKNVWISNSFINAELQGKFTLKTNKSKLVYTGEMSAVRGSAIFNNHDFKIVEGKLQFNNDPIFDPLFKINAQTKIDIFKIDLNVSGSTANPDFKLTSQPPLTQPEITALLTTGQAKNSIDSRDAGSVPAKMMMEYQKDQMIGGIKNKVKDALNLDELNVKTSGTTDKGGKIENSVSMGKYLNDKLYVNYTQNREKDVSKPVKHYQFNYKLNPNLDLNVKESNTEGSEMGVKLKKEF